MLSHVMCNTVNILLVEDSPTDVLMTREAFEDYKVPNPLHVVQDGEEAMDFLRRKGRHHDAPRPGLIILDLNLPKKSGREVLQELKTDPELMSIPVVVLTTSKSEKDVARSYGLHANCYVTKPVDFAMFGDVLRRINDFWFSVVTLPPAAS
ncbi:response regulator [Paraburkholderia sp. EG304]|uniref:response regulator n=1 Tax=Paraburkholderia sp. EG304 TaxID=3237015 RepID=UPI00397D945C